MDDIAVTDRSLIWNTDLVETLELRQPDGAGRGDHVRAPKRARKAAAPMPARISPSATTRTG